MNFPEVPFDENLFASNTMLKSYWERSTNERASATIPDWPSEESTESKELRLESLDHWSQNTQEQNIQEQEEIIDTKITNKTEVPVGPLGSRVEPKLSTSNTIALILAGVAVVLIMLYFFYRLGEGAHKKSAKRE